jgi:hypothetical protein
MNDVMKILKEEEIDQTDHQLDNECSIQICFRVSAREKILARLERIEDMKYEYLSTH